MGLLSVSPIEPHKQKEKTFGMNWGSIRDFWRQGDRWGVAGNSFLRSTGQILTKKYKLRNEEYLLCMLIRQWYHKHEKYIFSKKINTAKIYHISQVFSQLITG